jgi:hypothetical protein
MALWSSEAIQIAVVLVRGMLGPAIVPKSESHLPTATPAASVETLESQGSARRSDSINTFKSRVTFERRNVLQEEEAFGQKQQEAQDARYEVALRVVWITLGIGCAVLGTVLLGILLR